MSCTLDMLVPGSPATCPVNFSFLAQGTVEIQPLSTSHTLDPAVRYVNWTSHVHSTYLSAGPRVCEVDRGYISTVLMVGELYFGYVGPWGSSNLPCQFQLPSTRHCGDIATVHFAYPGLCGKVCELDKSCPLHIPQRRAQGMRSGQRLYLHGAYGWGADLWICWSLGLQQPALSISASQHKALWRYSHCPLRIPWTLR